MGSRPKLHGDKDRLIPAELRDAVLEHIEGDDVNPHARIAILLGDQAGLRISEVVKLQVVDCDLARAPYRLLIRGAKHRDADHVDEQPIGDDLAEALTQHFDGLFPHDGGRPPVEHFVFGGRETPYTRQHVLTLVKEVYADCGLPSIYNFHSLRHGYGTRIYIETKDLMLTSRMLRHRSSKPTERYVHMATQLEEMGNVLAAIAATSSGRRKSPKKPQKKKAVKRPQPKKSSTKSPKKPQPKKTPKRGKRGTR